MIEENVKEEIIYEEVEVNKEVLNDNEFNPEELLSLSRPKRLKKKAQVQKEKKINKMIGMSFFEVEAELGSDNEEHDDIVRKVDREEDDLDEDSEENIKDLIAEGEENIYQDAETIQEKYFDDMLEFDKELVKQVINGPKMLNAKRTRSENNLYEDDELPLIMRLKRAKSDAEKNLDNPEFALKKLFRNFKSVEKQIGEEGSAQNEELSQMYENMQNQLIRQVSEKSKDHHKELIGRIKENEKILQNVISLNSQKKGEEEKKNVFFIKGSFTTNTNGTTRINTVNPFKSSINPRNSFLQALKTDKYQSKQENVNELNIPKEGETSSNTNGKSSQICPIFHGSSKPSQVNSNKTSNLSALFTRSNKQRHSDKPGAKANSNNALSFKSIMNE